MKKFSDRQKTCGNFPATGLCAAQNPVRRPRREKPEI
jgi:hypothetical protein